MQKKPLLNFGCGTRYDTRWNNIDFHSESNDVTRVNLLTTGFPFPDNSFDAVYSSHVLEHFSKSEGSFLISEAYRILRPGGVLRIVVPDLEGSCLEYLRIMNLPDSDPKKHLLYDWIIIELLDQMVRTAPWGEMGAMVNKVMKGQDEELKRYIKSRTQSTQWKEPRKSTFGEKLKKITPQKLSTKSVYWYLKLIRLLIPSKIRTMVFVETGIFERHKWMYDHYNLRRLLSDIGFRDIERCVYNESRINNFNDYGLDNNKDGEPYKYNSLYMEGIK